LDEHFGFPVVAGIEQPNEYFRVAEALERLAKGETQAEIARTFGVHEATVGRLA
jgi:hypothetical protein